MRFVTLFWHVLAALVGATVALAAVAVHRTMVEGLPVGLVVSLGATLVVAWALRLQHRRLAASYCLGWVVTVGLTITGRPEGDYAIASDLRGYLLMAVSLAVIVIGLTSLASRDSPSSPGPP